MTFRYRQPFADGGKHLQHGLIAEEVAEVMPSLAVFNKDKEPETVKYHKLPVCSCTKCNASSESCLNCGSKWPICSRR